MSRSEPDCRAVSRGELKRIDRRRHFHHCQKAGVGQDDPRNYTKSQKFMAPFAFDPGRFTKLAWSLPWLSRYPLWSAREAVRRITHDASPAHLVFVIANHFEPGYNEEPNESGGLGITLDWATQRSKVERWRKLAREIGKAVQDHDGTPLRHTNFYPGEQYHRALLDDLASLQAEGLGEVEIHLHHGVERPDTAANLRQALVEFRDTLAEDHKCLSRMDGTGKPRYAFIHGNWALANSVGGKYCGVDSEMEILEETGCYADMTLPSAPDRSQVTRINTIYQCGLPLNERAPHRRGPSLKLGDEAKLPIIFTGPLVLDLSRRRYGLPLPRFDNGVLSHKYPLTPYRLESWRRAHIGVQGRPDWIFIKLFCHGFLPNDESAVIGEELRRFFGNTTELGARSGRFKVHFASAREAFNMVMAAVDGRPGGPGLYRDYRLRQIMTEVAAGNARQERESQLVVR